MPECEHTGDPSLFSSQQGPGNIPVQRVDTDLVKVVSRVVDPWASEAERSATVLSYVHAKLISPRMGAIMLDLPLDEDMEEIWQLELAIMAKQAQPDPAPAGGSGPSASGGSGSPSPKA